MHYNEGILYAYAWRLLYREHGLLIVIVSHAHAVLYSIIYYFRLTIDDVSYVSIIAGSFLLEALHSYCCQSSVSILVGAGSQH